MPGLELNPGIWVFTYQDGDQDVAHWRQFGLPCEASPTGDNDLAGQFATGVCIEDVGSVCNCRQSPSALRR